MSNIFQGLITAIITPFKNHQLDLDALEKILQRQLDANVDGVVIAGSTGEGSNLSFEEYKLLVKTSVKIINKRIPVIAGCSSNNTSYAIKLAQECYNMQVDGFMCSIPSYVKPTQLGIYKHFEAVHNASNMPVILYSVPSRTNVDFSDETILALAKLPRITAFKDAGSDVGRALRIKTNIDKDFNLLSGNDETNLAYSAEGGSGWISVVANLVPKLCKTLQEQCTKGDFTSAFNMHRQLLPLYEAVSLETNPISVKYAAHYLGLCENEIRLPLTIASKSTQKQIQQAVMNECYVGV